MEGAFREHAVSGFNMLDIIASREEQLLHQRKLDTIARRAEQNHHKKKQLKKSQKKVYSQILNDLILSLF